MRKTSSTKRKVCVVTGARSDYGLFYPVLKRIELSENLDLQLIATTMHLAPSFGSTLHQIEKDGFRVDETVENLLCAETKSSIAKSTGLVTVLISDAYKRLDPDIVLLLGDRYETLAAATASLLMNIPIAHIHGGEITEGAIDEQMRHAISKMSNIHFTATERYRKRLIQMGEAPSRVFNTGAPGIDNMLSMKLPDKNVLEKDLGWDFGEKSAIFSYHPETLGSFSTEKQIDMILDVVEKSGLNIIFTYANADNDGAIINNAIEEFCRKDPARFKAVKSLGQYRYLGAMKYIDILIGNTSSGIIEAATFHKPVVNIGNRQKGRLRSGNVIDCEIETLKSAIDMALSSDFRKECKKVKNIYGSGDASLKIVEILETVSLDITKPFFDLANDHIANL